MLIWMIAGRYHEIPLPKRSSMINKNSHQVSNSSSTMCIRMVFTLACTAMPAQKLVRGDQGAMVMKR